MQLKNEKKQGVLGNQKGFTLIEMAIVLVIIGIIIGAVVKGQDLIANAQAKQLNSAVSTWRNLVYAFLDRNGRLPGDQIRNGNVSDQVGEQTIPLSAIGELTATMKNYPGNPVIIGSQSYFIYIGSVTGFVATPAIRNAIFICGNADCSAVLTQDQVEAIKAVDSSYDGLADGGLGQIRALKTALAVTTADAAIANTNPPVSAGVVTTTGVVANIGDITSAGSSVPWSTAHFGAVWLFDKSF